MARLLFPVADRDKYMLILSAYFDETGSEADPNSKVAGMGGLLAPAYRWEVFEEKWKKALAVEGVDYFHMKEFAHSVGQFQTWKGDADRRRNFYDLLWSLIVDVQPLILGCFYPLQEYRSMLSLDHRKSIDDIYFLAYQSCLGGVMEYTWNQWDSTGEVATIFDDKKGFKGRAMEMYEFLMTNGFQTFQHKLPSPVFRDMRKIVPLQAADIIAYECAKELERRLYKPQFNVRPGFGYLERYYDAFNGPQIELGNPETPIIFYSVDDLEELRTTMDKQVFNVEMKNDGKDLERFQKMLKTVTNVSKEDVRKHEDKAKSAKKKRKGD